MTQNVRYPAQTLPALPGDTFSNYLWLEGKDLGFYCTRYWWKQGEVRCGIEPFVRKKLKPGSDPVFGIATKAEVLLPADAPGDFADIDFLLPHYDRSTPPFAIHAMMHFKFMLPKDKPWHAGYESVRTFLRDYLGHTYAVIAITHIPARAGLTSSGNHVHAIVLPRPLTIDGFGGANNELCSDTGFERALDAWETHLLTEEMQA